MPLTLDAHIEIAFEKTCHFKGCRNAARYITVDERFACGSCPIEHKVDAIKIASVPELLKLVRSYLDVEDPVDPTTALARSGVPSPRDRPGVWIKAFREIVGRDASQP